MTHECKREGCNKRRPPGNGYCSHECYWEAQGREDQKWADKQEKMRKEVEEERRVDPKSNLADRLWPDREEWERDDLMDDLLALVASSVRYQDCRGVVH